MERRSFLVYSLAVTATASLSQSVMAIDPYGPSDAKITLIVLDPLALPLACSCVEGYAQRKYEKLADHLQSEVGQTVRVVWSESLEKALEGQAEGKATIIVGKDSVLRSDSKKNKLDLIPVAQLTDRKGSVMQHGVFIVRQENPAATLLDLENYKILWGPEKCDEKYSAPKSKLEELAIPSEPGGECPTCSVAAKELIAESADAKLAAVISSYAEPLLTGCGTVKKGELKMVGRSDDVPFVSAFVNAKLDQGQVDKIRKALLSLKSEELLSALESKDGFVEYASRSE